MDKVLGDKKAIAVFVLPAFFIYVTIVIIPLFISAYYSTFQWDGIGEKIAIGLDNYKTLFFEDRYFIKSIGNSFTLTLLTLLIQLPLAIILALILANGIKGEAIFRTVLFIPVMLSAVVIGHLFRRIYEPNFGLINIFLQNIGLENLAKPWLGDMKTALYAASAPIIWQWIGYHMLLLYAAAKSVPQDLREAAKLDGANSIQCSFKIVLPLMTPVIRICIIMLVIGSLREFDMIYTMTGGGPAHASEMPSTMMINTLFSRYQYGLGSSMAVFIVIECLLLTLIIQKIFKTTDVTY
jgi:raffinose/stachyose/melibiose transport system permease protein